MQGLPLAAANTSPQLKIHKDGFTESAHEEVTYSDLLSDLKIQDWKAFSAMVDFAYLRPFLTTFGLAAWGGALVMILTQTHSQGLRSQISLQNGWS